MTHEDEQMELAEQRREQEALWAAHCLDKLGWPERPAPSEEDMNRRFERHCEEEQRG